MIDGCSSIGDQLARTAMTPERCMLCIQSVVGI